jgi:cyclophilin family peptidyl-prolyl cis-trans isomerase
MTTVTINTNKGSIKLLLNEEKAPIIDGVHNIIFS